MVQGLLSMSKGLALASRHGGGRVGERQEEEGGERRGGGELNKTLFLCLSSQELPSA